MEKLGNIPNGPGKGTSTEMETIISRLQSLYHGLAGIDGRLAEAVDRLSGDATKTQLDSEVAPENASTVSMLHTMINQIDHRIDNIRSNLSVIERTV